MLYYEKKFLQEGYRTIIGVDEVGRGPLAGPVVASAVTLNNYNFSCRIDDSKKLSPRQRETAFRQIIGQSVFGIGVINEKIIDRLNIRVASEMAMEQAVRALLERLRQGQRRNCCLLVDGRITLKLGHFCLGIVRGDGKSLSIASASILAKVVRDRIMSLYDKRFPKYGFLKHKGYPTQMHRRALEKYGPCLIHRMSFSGV